MSTSERTGGQIDDSIYRGIAKRNIEVIFFDGLIPPDNIDPEIRLKELYIRVENWSKDAIAWYLKRKKLRKWPSLFMRLLAAACTIVGGLIPLLIPILTNKSFNAKFSCLFFFNDLDPFVIGQFGYVFLALAAAFYTIDRLFDFSTGWMRSMSTTTALEALLVKFQLDWQIIWNKKSRNQTPGIDPHDEMLALLKSFCLQFLHEIGEETENWKKRLKKSLELAEKELEKAKEEKVDDQDETQ